MDAELTEVRDFLAAHAPFDVLPPRVLDALPAQLSARYFRRGTRILSVGERCNELYVVRSGAVDTHDASGTLIARADEGTAFGMSLVMLDAPSEHDFTAYEDSLVIAIPGDVFTRLRQGSGEFDRFFTALLTQRMRMTIEPGAGGDQILRTQVREMVRKAPVTTSPETPVRDAARTMTEHNVSSLLISRDERLLGIVTDRDMRSKVVAGGLDPAQPVEQIMTPEPITIHPEALALEALLVMLGRHIHHLPVVDDAGAPVGMVSSTDLVRLEQSNPVHLVGDIAAQSTPEGIAQVAQRMPGLVARLVEQDSSAEDIGRVIAAVGDGIERRLIALAEAEIGPPPVPYAWVVLGSRARLEPGLASDQDNALVLADEARPEHDAWFAGLAERVVAGLEAAGYPRCPGDIMATNPQWRMPVSQWRRQFATWLRQPEPDAVLRAQIFFDMRVVHGDASLVTDMQARIAAAAPESRVFLTHLARQAVHREPPLGFFRGLVLEREGEHRDTLDLKAGGVGAVVEIARVLALAKGSPAVGTLPRLAAAVRLGALSPETGEDLAGAFEFISHLRLRHQTRQLREGRAADNHISPAELTGLEQRHLRDAFGVVRSTQKMLTTMFPASWAG